MPGMNPPGSVFLVGPMGVGKSTIGRRLAALLQRRFVDSDHEIERRTGARIPLIFEIEGEDGFRRREAAVIAELSAAPDTVMATGGGAVLNEGTRALLRSRGTVVYLHADLEVLVERTCRDRNRPLLQTDDPRTRLEQIMREREPLYRAVADIIVDTSARNPDRVAREIITRFKSLKKPAAPHENTEG